MHLISLTVKMNQFPFKLFNRLMMIHFKSFLWTLSFMSYLCLTTSIQAEEKVASPLSALIPRQLLFGNPEKTSAKLSPDATKLAYLAPDANNVLNVWVRDLKQDGQDRQVTTDRKRGIRQFLWQFNNEHILYIQDKDGDENWHLYQTHVATQATKDLTPFDGVKAEIIDADPRFPMKCSFK